MKKSIATAKAFGAILFVCLMHNASAQTSSQLNTAVFKKVLDFNQALHLTQLRQRFGRLNLQRNDSINTFCFDSGVFTLDSARSGGSLVYLIESRNTKLIVTPLDNKLLTDSIPSVITIYPQDEGWVVQENFSQFYGYYFFQKRGAFELLLRRLETWNLTKVE